MPLPSKISNQGEKKKITDYTVKNLDNPGAETHSSSSKRSSSVLSPLENHHQAKKANMAQEESTITLVERQGVELKEVIGPLIAEVTQPLLTEIKLLRESVDNRYDKLEEAITSHHQEVTD